MMFLLPKNLSLTSAAKDKILTDFWAAPHGGQVTVLFYVHKSVRKSKAGEVLSEKHDFFAWGAHLRSDVPDDALWVINGHQLAIQDGRWEPNELLLLDVQDGNFRVKPH